jgi:DNA-binding LytR/AlgR family response regulator
VEELQPDLILLDIMLPNKDGVEVCREVRKKYDMSPMTLSISESFAVSIIIGISYFFRTSRHTSTPSSARVSFWPASKRTCAASLRLRRLRKNQLLMTFISVMKQFKLTMSQLDRFFSF